MRRIRICQLITELRPAGAERCVYELARRIDRERFEMRVACLRGGSLVDSLREAGIAVTVLGVRGKWDVLKLARLSTMLARAKIDLLHTHLFHADLAGRAAASLAGVPHLLHTVHVAEGRFRPWQFAYARAMAGCCERIVCVSNAVRDFHASRTGLPADRYLVIHNGVDAAAYARDDAERTRLRDRWAVRSGDMLVAFVGRLDQQKGVDTLLAAAEKLTGRGAIKFVIAGDGPQREMVESFVDRQGGSGCVRYLGRVDEVRAILSAADMLAMPSRWEGLPLAAAEAMAASLPIVATRVAGLSELVVDGETGLLIPPDDATSLVEAIERLAGDAALREKLGAAGRQRVIKKFSIDTNVAAHEKLYLQIVGRRRQD